MAALPPSVFSAPAPAPTQNPAQANTFAQLRALNPPGQPAGQSPNLIRQMLYALQAYDAANSANFMAHGGGINHHETNPMMAPFSHMGPLGYAMGFGLGDLVRAMLLKHASQGTKNTADILQGLSNLQGISQTNATAKRLGQP